MTTEEAINWFQSKVDDYLEPEKRHVYTVALAALRAQQERENLWHDAKENHPKVPGLYYGKKDDTNSMWLCQYRDGVWTLDMYPEQKMPIVQWAEYASFSSEQESENNEPLTLDELRQMDGEPVWDNFRKERCVIMIDFYKGKGVVKYFDGGFNRLSEKRFYRHKPKED